LVVSGRPLRSGRRFLTATSCRWRRAASRRLFRWSSASGRRGAMAPASG